MKYQFMPMFWGDFFANTLHLTAQEVGAYVLLIAHAWENEGHIPYDRLQRIARVNPYHWARVWQRLEPFFEVEKPTTVGAPLWVAHRRVLQELTKAAELSNKRKGAAEHLLSKRGSKTAANTPPSILQLPIESLSNGKGREAPQERVVPAAPVNYRDPGVDYRSPPAKKSDLPPLTDEQRLAAVLLAAKTDQSKPRKDANHERQTDHAQSHADAAAQPNSVTDEPIE